MAQKWGVQILFLTMPFVQLKGIDVSYCFFSIIAIGLFKLAFCCQHYCRTVTSVCCLNMLEYVVVVSDAIIMQNMRCSNMTLLSVLWPSYGHVSNLHHHHLHFVIKTHRCISNVIYLCVCWHHISLWSLNIFQLFLLQ